ncbi:hypothetical protein OEZ86_009121 [Tetradesmus obliquus]|nr:hypothetical protein OEZ86_009121 [Tetradesmus obliquus]
MAHISWIVAAYLLLLCIQAASSNPLSTDFTETRPVREKLSGAAQAQSAAALAQAQRGPHAGKLTRQLQPKQLVLPGEYIVTVRPEADISSILRRQANAQALVKSTFSVGSLKGFSVLVSPSLGGDASAVLSGLLADGNMLLARPWNWLLQVQPRLGSDASAVLSGLLADGDVLQLEPVTLLEHAATQSSPSWGLDRIDQVSLPLDSRYTFAGTSTAAGAGVWIYILDSGVRWNHTNLQGRGRAGTFWPYVGVSNELDNNGHGTHVAGIAASERYGVAKGANIVSVKVLDDLGLGSSDALVAGLNWVVADRRVANHRKVINLSLSGTPSEAVDAAVYQTYLAGLSLVTAAGNSNDDACSYTPARARGLLTVAATMRTDAKADFSNTGPCVDLFAPGVSISSIGHTSDTARGVVKSGTSMSSPFVAGVAARIVASGSCGTGVEFNDCVYDTILSQATRNRVSGKGARTPNRLLFRAATLP